jgi:hypothetical protein
MPFCAHLCLIDEIISKISQNDLHILHNGHICQTCKIIRVNIELAILAFILPTSGHANFECQQPAWRRAAVGWLICSEGCRVAAACLARRGGAAVVQCRGEEHREFQLEEERRRSPLASPRGGIDGTYERGREREREGLRGRHIRSTCQISRSSQFAPNNFYFFSQLPAHNNFFSQPHLSQTHL